MSDVTNTHATEVQQATDAILATNEKVTNSAMQSANQVDELADALLEELDKMVANTKNIVEAHRTKVRSDMERFCNIFDAKMKDMAHLTAAYIEHCQKASEQMTEHVEGVGKISTGYEKLNDAFEKSTIDPVVHELERALMPGNGSAR